MDFDSLEKIAIRMPNWIGDVVMATPFLRGVRHHFPKAEITLLMRPHLTTILEGAPWVDRLYPLSDRGLWGPFKAGLSLRKENFDAAFILPTSWRTALTFSLAGIPRRIGYDLKGRGLLLTHKARIKDEEWEGKLRPIPTDLFYLRLLEAIGKPYTNRQLELPLLDKARRYQREFFKEQGLSEDDFIVALNPGAAFGSSKLWPLEYFATTADRLVREEGAKILILCGPGEENLARQIAEKMEEPALCTASNIVPLYALGAVLKACSLLISTDSGPRHFATAFNTPLIVLMGPIHPGYTELAQEDLSILREPVKCSPCHLKTCPIDHRCMTRLTPERVVQKAKELLSPGKSSRGHSP